MFRRVTLVGLALVVSAFSLTPASGQGDAKKKDKAPKDEAGIDTTPHKLFRSQEPITMTITVDLKKLVRMRERQSAPLPASLVYDAGSQGKETLLINVSTRGNFRLSSRNCDFPPIRVFFEKAEVKKTVFDKEKDLKLVTRCKDTKEYEQYILQEERIYHIYNMLTPISLRTRLVNVTYRDTLHKEKDVKTWAFFVEDANDMAKRVGGRIFTAKQAVFEDVDPHQMRIVGLLEYMIANTDWSLGALHNTRLMRGRDSVTVFPLAYDFDFSGVINTRYATPDPQLNIRTVRDRLYRGPCMTPQELDAAGKEFSSKKDAIYALYDSQKEFDPAVVKQTKEFYDEFFKTLADPRRAKREIIDNCQSVGN
jgi:hypothetical protein